jgi:biotin carboxyl carrier protein
VTFEVDVNGRTRAVGVERVAGSGHYRVTVDGRVHLLEVARIGDYGLSVLVEGETAPLSREIHVVPSGARGEVLITLDGRTVAGSVNARRTGRAAVDARDHAHGEQKVVAPMPGRIVRVLVEAGDEVAARQAIVVIEAMKMENELRSPKAGRVKEVAVTGGASVEAGRTLVVIE